MFQFAHLLRRHATAAHRLIYELPYLFPPSSGIVACEEHTMSREIDELQKQLAVGQAKHEAFREHAHEYKGAAEDLQAEVSDTLEALTSAKEQAGTGSPDAPAQRAKVEHLQQDRREQAMVRDGLRQDFKDLNTEFAELK